MRSFYREASHFFLALSLVPLLIGLVDAFSPGLGIVGILIGLPTLAITLLVGGSIWLMRGIRRAPEGAPWTTTLQYVAASPVMVSLVLLSAWPSLMLGSYLGDMGRLAANFAHYERIIAKAQRARKAEWFSNDHGVEYSVDVGPPVRVAFNPAGMLDNWSAIIFDPTGEMLKADGFDPATGKFYASDKITKLFGGDLVTCRRLWGDFLTCSFT